MKLAEWCAARVCAVEAGWGHPRPGWGEIRRLPGQMPERRQHLFVGERGGIEEYEGRPDAVRATTQRLTSALERGVRRAPEQYFWLHRRWKHQPMERKRKPAA